MSGLIPTDTLGRRIGILSAMDGNLEAQAGCGLSLATRCPNSSPRPLFCVLLWRLGLTGYSGGPGEQSQPRLLLRKLSQGLKLKSVVLCFIQ